MKTLLLSAVLCYGMFLNAPVAVGADRNEVTVNLKEDTVMEYVKPEGYKSTFPWHGPMGKGIGAMPGRVVWAYAPESVQWKSGNWSEPNNFDASTIRNMVNNGIANLAGAHSAKEGWNVLFMANNKSREKGSVGYKPGEKIAIKVNMNGAGWYNLNDKNTKKSYSNPAVVRQLLLSMVEDGGVRPEDITIYEVSRNLPEHMVNHIQAPPLQKVNFKYYDEGGPNDTLPDRSAPIVWSKKIRGETGYLPKCVTEAEYLINFATLKGHTMNGVTLTAKNHFGSIHNSERLAPPVAAGLHEYVLADGMNQYSPLVDLWSNKNIGPKTFLYVLEGLLAIESEEATIDLGKKNAIWMQEPFNGGYAASIFFSQDPLAIESVGADFLMNEPTVQKLNSRIRNNPNVENYLHEAANVSNPPSGTKYLNGAGEKVTNLGVHEHWNNPKEKLYSRNLGKPEGIELIRTDGKQH